MIIYPVCNKCGNRLTLKLNIVDKLKKEIQALKNRIIQLENKESINDIFGGIFK